jgi:hypothetical protein
MAVGILCAGRCGLTVETVVVVKSKKEHKESAAAGQCVRQQCLGGADRRVLDLKLDKRTYVFRARVAGLS